MPKFADHEETAKKYNIGTGGGSFWKPEPGNNRVRILSEYEAYGSHWIQADGRSYTCIGKDNGCQYCQSGEQPRAQFLMWVLVKTFDANGVETGSEVRLGQIGYSVIKQIGELAKDSDWGFDTLPPYDVVIKRVGEKLKTEYFITPTPDKSELTTDQQVMVDEVMKPVSEIIGKMKEKAGGEASTIQVDESGPMDKQTPPIQEDDGEIKVDNIPF